MKMHYIEFADFVPKRASQRRCPIETSEQRTGKISDPNAFQINRNFEWDGTVSRPVHVCSIDLDFMSSCRHRLAEAVNGKDRSSVADSRQVTRDDVEDPQNSRPLQNQPYYRFSFLAGASESKLPNNLVTGGV